MSIAPGRTTHAQAILGPELHAQLSRTNVLMVGAGGIGCELLKNIVLTGFGNITILDLDTIDLSNLNRQFLFRKKDVKQSKALVASQTAAPFNPNVKITPIHGNIKEPQYDVEWFKQFDIVLNALDNLDARRHVNKMCMAAEVPLVESGTAGYLGQVQPLLKDRTECFDCIPKPTPKTFPVCTIRSTPSQPIHCIVWSKSYLMGQLFGEDEDAVGELDEAEKQGENAQEIETLRKEAQAFKAVRRALRTPSPNGSSDVAKAVFDKVFNADIKNLLIMADMWKARQPPTPLDFDAIMSGTFVHHPVTVNGTANGNGSATPSASSSGPTNGMNGNTEASQAVLRDQRKLSLKDNLELFVSSTNRLASRLQNGEDTISFDKDDDDTLDFVTASSNLRSVAYGIDEKTRWEVKEMAGNIIPAIATTNAIVSGLIVLQALHLLRKSYDKLRNVHLQFKPSVPISSITLSGPTADCGICRDTYVVLQCDPTRAKLGDVVKGLLGDDEREVSVFEDKRMLSDPDWDDNLERTLESLNVTRGKFLSIVDEEGDRGSIAANLCELPPNHPADAPPFILPSPLPNPPKRVKPKLPAAPATPPPLARDNFQEDEDGVIEIDPTPRRPSRLQVVLSVSLLLYKPFALDASTFHIQVHYRSFAKKPPVALAPQQPRQSTPAPPPPLPLPPAPPTPTTPTTSKSATTGPKKTGQPRLVAAHFIVGNAYPYTVDDWSKDITLAASKGIDAFSLNIGHEAWQFRRAQDAYTAAKNLNSTKGISFRLFPSFDMSTLPCAMASQGEALQDFVTEFHNHSNQFMYKGKMFVTTFGGEQCSYGQKTMDDGWWKILKSGKIGVFLVTAFFQDPALYGGYRSPDGALAWNSAWPMGNYPINSEYDEKYFECLGNRTYMAAVSPWMFTNFVYRGDDWLFASRWELLVAQRKRIHLIQVISWNDYGESHYIGPISDWLDLMYYYIVAFKTGKYPPIDKDRVFLWGRLYPKDLDVVADPVGKPRNWDFTQDSIWAVLFLQAESQITFSCGSARHYVRLPAGVSKIYLNVTEECQVTIVVARLGAVVMDFTPKGFTFQRSPKVYNFNAFVAASPA
ncbi:hypothetical protein NP233_g8693 [Leucocoprinus birnbaumii]|uniref:Ubiquitin-activating enzyme E1-like n=1 Tax=Leucocoprinus birnbaumii TaxID=56174 RepID=A0AAD5YMW4_9AGAR|nr:hypothetical protein NP233_g8693 [Leucocoprinus birnbaumii]